jgi:hypothetical protein
MLCGGSCFDETFFVASHASCGIIHLRGVKNTSGLTAFSSVFISLAGPISDF